MSLLRKNLRIWWSEPRKISDRETERKVSFLELFYDLVYVVLIAELAHTLVEHLSFEGLVNFAFLFLVVWWSWINGMGYHELHGNNDIRTRFFTFLQMFTVVAMIVFAHNALEEGSVGFALSYAAFQLVLTYLWWQAGQHDPEHRLISRPWSLSYVIIMLMFIASIFVEPPVRFYFWAAGLLFSLLLPMLTMLRSRYNESVKEQFRKVSFTTESAVERFGLFTIIVLGEVIVGVVQGVAAHETLTLRVGLAAALGLLLAIGVWWLYFDHIAHRIPQESMLKSSGWMYLHLPMTLAIGALGAMISYIVKHANDAVLPAEISVLFIGTVVTVLLCIRLMLTTIIIPEILTRAYKTSGRAIVVSILLLLTLSIVSLNLIAIDIISFLFLINVLIFMPIFFVALKWIEAMALEQDKDKNKAQVGIENQSY